VENLERKKRSKRAGIEEPNDEEKRRGERETRKAKAHLEWC